MKTYIENEFWKFDEMIKDENCCWDGDKLFIKNKDAKPINLKNNNLEIEKRIGIIKRQIKFKKVSFIKQVIMWIKYLSFDRLQIYDKKEGYLLFRIEPKWLFWNNYYFYDYDDTIRIIEQSNKK